MAAAPLRWLPATREGPSAAPLPISIHWSLEEAIRSIRASAFNEASSLSVRLNEAVPSSLMTPFKKPEQSFFFASKIVFKKGATSAIGVASNEYAEGRSPAASPPGRSAIESSQ